MGSKTVHRTANTRRAAVEDMSINHRRRDVAMAQDINGSWNLFQLRGVLSDLDHTGVTDGLSAARGKEFDTLTGQSMVPGTFLS
jgi:hypothetical protein